MAKRYIHTVALLLILGAFSALAAGVLGTVQDSLSTYAPGAMAVHIIKFTNTIAISRTGSIEVTFPDSTQPSEPKFRLVSGQIIAAFGELSPAAARGGFSTITVSGDSVRCYRDGAGTDIASGTRVTLLLALVRNPYEQRLNSRIRVNIYDGTSPFPMFDRGVSAPYHIDGPAISFSFATVPSQVVGQPFALQAFGAKDVYGHSAGGTISVIAQSGGGAAPDGTLPALASIRLRDGSGQSSQLLFKAETGVVLQGNSSLTTLSTNTFSVSPGPANLLAISGEPLAVAAGASFAGAVSVKAFDSHDNLATAYSGTVNFFNNDPRPQPGDLPPSTALTAGEALFPGSAFTLRTAGQRRIWVSDGSRVDTTGVINVSGGNIDNYALTVTTTPLAGQPATISVSSARDANGNLASGTVSVAFADGNANHSIAGNFPIFSTIAVSNGSGSGSATFFKAENVVTVQGMAGSVARTSNFFSVLPGTLGGLSLIPDPITTPLPAAVIAGDSLGSSSDNLLVVIRDSYGNVKTDFTGTAGFFSSDPLAVYPAPYNFVISDAGARLFGRDQFRFRTIGNQTISVQTGSYSQKLDPVLVHSDGIISFALTAATSQVAGVPFLLSVSNARDQFDNLAEGLVQIRAISGGGLSPSGQPATFTAIPVNGGSGQAAQTLVKTATTRLIGEVKSGAVVLASDEAPDITMQPGALGALQLSGLPASIPSGTPFPGTIVVTAYDQYGNLKTDYTGTVQFSSSAALAVFPGPFTFSSGAQASWSGALFTINTPGGQTISVRDRDAAPVISTASGIIDVSALVINRIFAAATQVSQGQTNIRVQMDLLNYGNQEVTSVGGGLNFRTNRDGDFTYTGPPVALSVPARIGSTPGSRTMEFLVNVERSAGAGAAKITGFASGIYMGSPASASDTALFDSWLVQQEAALILKGVDVKADTVNQGQYGIVIECEVQNGDSSGFADAHIEGTDFAFRLDNASDVSASFSATADVGNSAVVTANQSVILRYYLQAATTAPIGSIYVYPTIHYKDGNSAAAKSTVFSQNDNFYCQEAGAIEIYQIQPSQSSVTRGQTSSWTVTVGVHNNGASPITVDFNPAKTKLEFRQAGTDFTDYFSVMPPPAFDDYSSDLAGGATKQMLFTVAGVSAPPGAYSIVSRIETTDGLKASDAFGSILVQTEEDLRISGITPSQERATVNDSTWPWSVDVALGNQGGSDVEIDTVTSRLIFSGGSGFSVGRPRLIQNSTILRGGQSDVLRFPILRAGSPAGVVTITAAVVYNVLNSGALDSVQTPSGSRGFVTLQNLGNGFIAAVKPAPLALTRGQTAPWRVTLSLNSQSGAGNGDIEIDLDTPASTYVRMFKKISGPGGDELVWLPEYDLQMPASLAGSGTRILKAGIPDSLIFTGIVPIDSTGEFQLEARVSGRDVNSRRSILFSLAAPAVSIQVQTPANLLAMANSIQPAYVSGGSFYRFQLNIMNIGGSTLELNPSQTVLSFTDGTTSYSALLDAAFGATLPGSSTRTLYFHANALLPAIIAGNYVPTLTVAGMQNGNVYAPTPLLLSQNSITVANPREVMITALRSETPTVTAGQSKPWYISLDVTNNGSSVLRLDSTRIAFYRNSVDVSSRFALVKPDTFTTGSTYIRGDSSATVRYRVDAVDATLNPGQINISGHIWLTDSTQAFRRFDEQTDQGNSGYVLVQEPADPAIIAFSPSQSTVTRGQTVPWTITALVRNRGGSTVALDLSKILLSFSAGDTNFVVQAPVAFSGSGALLLEPGAEDSLRWTVQEVDTSAALLGVVRVDAAVGFAEINSDRAILLNTTIASQGFDITVQNSAQARLAGFRIVVPQDSLVNGGQIFYVQARVANPGSGESLRRSRVRFSANGFVTFTGSAEAEVGSIPAGGSLWTEPGVLIKADTTDGLVPTLSARIISAEAGNTGQPATVLPALAESDSSMMVYIQRPGILAIKRIAASRDTIPSGYSLDWTIAVDVTNRGKGSIVLNPPKASDITIKQGFVISPPVLTAEQRLLDGGDTLHVVYRVIASSSGSGLMPIAARVTAGDVNDTLRTVAPATAQTNVFVSTSARVRIVQTALNAEANRVDAAGIGHLNTRQSFFIDVDVENSGGQPLESVYVQLRGGKSQITLGVQLLSRLSAFEGPRRLSFAVIADSVENLGGETFEAIITQALGEDGSSAFIAPSMDATADIRIYRPARLKLISTAALTTNIDKIVSYNQTFPVEVIVENIGSEPVSAVALDLSADPAEKAVIPESRRIVVKTIAGGDTARVLFSATARAQSGQVLLNSRVGGSFGQNSRLSAPIETAGQDTSSLVTIESGANLRVLSVRAPKSITAGDAQNDWRIYVKVANEGDADLRFLDISPDNIAFYIDGTLDNDYRVNAPSKLMGGDSLVLSGQSQDSLLYIVTRNGDVAGTAEIRVQLKAMDVNLARSAANVLNANGATSLEVSSISWVRINQTVTLANQYDNLGLALVNRGRTFRVQVEAETSELTGVDSVRVQIAASGGSSIVQPTFLIPHIGKGSTGLAEFTVIADDSWDAMLSEKRETFTANIISANAEGTRLAAQIREPARPLDALTYVRTQNPARLALQIRRDAGQDSILTAGQEFQMLVSMVNRGSAAMRTGQFRLVLPAGKNYRLAKGTTERFFDVPLGQAAFTDTLSLIAPLTDSFSDTLSIQLIQVPEDVNTRQPAAVENVAAQLIFTTLQSGLALNFAIDSPAGAKDRILSTAQQMVLRGIVQSTDNIQEKTAKIQLPVSPAYVLLSAAEQAVTSSPDTVYWRIQVPGEETVLAHNFLAEARGHSADGWQTAQKSVTIDQIVSRADLWLDNLEVSSPAEGVMESGQANFSVRQQATLRTRVRNLGKSRVGATGKVTLSVLQSGLSLVGSDSTKSFTAGSFVTWNVQAADMAIGEIRDIRVEISTTPDDENTSAPASVANGTTSLNVRTEERGLARIDKFYINSPSGALDNIISAEQSFEVTAEITSTNVKDLLANLSFTGAFSTNTPSVSVAAGPGKIVKWTLKAPADAGVNTLSLTLSAKDFRSSTALTNQIRSLSVTTQPVARFTLTPKITFPAGLNNKVSSESGLKLTLYIQHQEDTAPFVATDAATIRLNAPADFLDGTEPLIKTGLDSMVWNLIAPAVRQDTLFDVNFNVNALPRDANSGLEASTDFVNIYFPIWVVRKARVEILAQVNNQPADVPVSVRIGNEFDLVSALHNLGSADYYGSYQVQLRLPRGYSTSSPLTVTTDRDSVSWRIKAPDRISLDPDTLVVKLLSAPRDFFSKTAAEIARDSAIVLISPEAGFMVAKSFRIKGGSVGLRGGTNVPMLGLSLQNKDQSVGSRSLLDTIRVSFRSRRGEPVPARSVISRIAAVEHGNPAMILAENRSPGSTNQAVLNFVKAVPDTIRGSDLFTIDILLDISGTANLTDFVVAIDSADAIVARDAIYMNRLSIADSSLKRVDYLGFSSGTMVVMQSDLEESFCNYPNPFGTPLRPTTRFVYNLSQASDVQIKIFTLTGDLVQAWEFTKAAHPQQTSAGVHQNDVVWDGRNGRGDKVMNGIYLAYLMTENGELALTKIAVVK